MYDGQIGVNDVATLGLLSRVGNGGYKNGEHEFANDGSNAVRINRNEKLNKQGHDFLSQQISDNADRNRDTLQTLQTNTQFDRVSDKLSDQTNFFDGSISRVAAATAVGQAEIIREMNANAREAAKCCCETQKLIAAEASATRSVILEVEARGVRDSLAAANAKVTQLETINALSGGHRGN